MRRIPIIPTVLVLAAVGVMIALGFWQLDRRAQKEAMLARYATAQQLSAEVPWPVEPAQQELALFRRTTIDCRVEGDQQRLERLALVLGGVDPVDEVGEDLAQPLDVHLRVHLHRAQVALRGVALERALELAELRRLEVAREPAGADVGADAEVRRGRPVGLLAPAPGDRLDQPGAGEHPHVEVQVARIDLEPAGELAVRERLVRSAERLEHLQPERMPERLQLLGAVELEGGLPGDRLRLGIAHRVPILAAAG